MVEVVELSGSTTKMSCLGGETHGAMDGYSAGSIAGWMESSGVEFLRFRKWMFTCDEISEMGVSIVTGEPQ